MRCISIAIRVRCVGIEGSVRKWSRRKVPHHMLKGLSTYRRTPHGGDELELLALNLVRNRTPKSEELELDVFKVENDWFGR